MPKLLTPDAAAYDKEYDTFIKQLEDFHQQRGTLFKKLPRINGKAIDLYLLYVVVTARGGWQKVNSRNEWGEIVEDFRLNSACVNSSMILKHIYIRYLDVYERIHFLGEDGNEKDNDNDEDDSRAVRLRKSVRNLNNVPLSYNQQQHNVTDATRLCGGLSTDMYKSSPYDRLALSLSCPLPNEHDFAFNMCTLLSNEGKHTLQLNQCPRLIELMLAHTGVFKDRHTQKYFISNYKESKGKSLVQFWIDAVDDKRLLDILDPDCILQNDSQKNNQQTTSPEPTNDKCEKSSDSTTTEDSSNNEQDKGPKKNGFSSKMEEVLAREVVELHLEPQDSEIFHLGRDIGLLDSEGTRISQVLHIIRNLSFEESNVTILSQSNTCLRFLVLCVCSRWGGLSIGALDTLGNIGTEVTLRDPAVDPTSALLLTTVCQGVSAQDRAFVLRCLEVLNKLALSDPNEEILSRNIEQTVFDQICRYLTIHDIMLLVYTLECLFSLSSLGTKTCNAIVRAKGSIQTLVSLLTVEAQSYGPEACIGMKVVETVTGVVSESESTDKVESPAPPNLQAPATTPASQTTATPQRATPSAPSTPKITPKPMDPRKLVARVVPQEVEDFAIDWIKKNYEVCATNAIEQAIVYRHFTAAMYNVGKKHGLNPIFLSNCIKKVFGVTVGPCKRMVDSVEKWHYVGIKRIDGISAADVSSLATPTPVLTPLGRSVQNSAENSTPIQGSILKAHLSSPLKTPPPSKVPVQHGIMRSGPENWQYGNVRPPQTDNSALIKSLLASKVTSGGMSSPFNASDRSGVVTHAQHHHKGSAPNTKDMLVSQSSPLPSIASSSTARPPHSVVQGGPLPSMPFAKYTNQLMVNRNLQKQNGPVELSNKEDKSVTVNGIMSEPAKSEAEIVPTTFEGILQNGLKKDSESDKPEGEKRNLLADLLEKTVGGDVLNGVVIDKEIKPEKNKTVTVNGPTSIQTGVKRPASSETPQPLKRQALEDHPKTGDGKITLYVSQNGTEGEVLSQGHQVILNQGHQIGTTSSSGQVVSTQTMVTPQGQVIIQRALSSHPNVIVQQSSASQLNSKPNVARSIITQSPAIIPSSHSSNTNQSFISQTSQSNSNQVQVLQTQSGQKVILHGGQLGQVLGNQMLVPQNNNQGIVVQGSQGQIMLQGVSNSQNPVILQSAGGNNQVILHGNNQGQVLLQNNSNQSSGHIVNSNSPSSSQNQLVVNNSSGQAMILANNQGQHVVVSGNNQSQGQMLVQGNNAVFLAPHQQSNQSGQKTLIILPNPKMVVTANQNQSGHVVLPRQVVQVVSGSGPTSSVSSTARTVKAPQTSNSPISIQVNTTKDPALNTLPKGPTATPVTHVSTVTSSSPHVPAPQVIASGVVKRTSTKSDLSYMCEWRGCNQLFGSPGMVYHHACKTHCPPHFLEITCQWSGCEPMTRKRYSAMTHLHDRHCNDQLLQINAMRRQQLSSIGKTDIPIPLTPPPHPGYAPNAAFHAIRRHALEVINQRDVIFRSQEKEGPVTKSIRLTAALILRNLVIYSNLGKKLLHGYESELANVAISSMESSRTVSQILYDVNLANPDEL